jgi:hypothetical protein
MTKHLARRALAPLLLVTLLPLVGGCAVKVYQRERLVDRIVSFKAEEKSDARRMKTLEAREGSTGGAGGAGGGCACK